MPRAVTTWFPMPPPAARDERRDQAPDKNARPVEETTGGDDYLESLGDAFDTLDRQLEGRLPTNQQRNPSPPLGHLHQYGDPRSPGRMPPAQSAATPGNPVYQVDEDWFGDNQSRDRGGRGEMNDEPQAQEVAPPPAQPVDQVDDEWFAEDWKARDARQLEQRELAREMGIHEVEMGEPAVAAPPIADDDSALARRIRPPRLRPVRLNHPGRWKSLQRSLSHSRLSNYGSMRPRR